MDQLGLELSVIESHTKEYEGWTLTAEKRPSEYIEYAEIGDYQKKRSGKQFWQWKNLDDYWQGKIFKPCWGESIILSPETGVRNLDDVWEIAQDIIEQAYFLYIDGIKLPSVPHTTSGSFHPGYQLKTTLSRGKVKFWSVCLVDDECTEAVQISGKHTGKRKPYTSEQDCQQHIDQLIDMGFVY